jgi:hypothetical protein
MSKYGLDFFWGPPAGRSFKQIEALIVQKSGKSQFDKQESDSNKDNEQNASINRD